MRFIVFSLVIAPCVALFAVSSAQAQVVVSPNNLGIWMLDGGGYGLPAQFAQAPAGNPYGASALLLKSGSPNSEASNITTSAFDGRYIRDISALSYSTFVTQGAAKPIVAPTNSDFAPYLNLYLDADGDGVEGGPKDTTLVFEPYLSAVDAPLVSYTSWQRWDALAGNWWSVDGQWNGAAFTHSGRDYRTLAGWLSVLNATSTAKIASNQFNTFRIQVGAGADDPGWQNRVMYADGLSIGFNGTTPTTYNFETTAVAPEPASISLLLTSVLPAFGLFARRKQQRKHAANK